MSQKENVIANLLITNELLRTEVSSLNDQIRFMDETIASGKKTILERDVQIGELQKTLSVAESKIPSTNSGGILSYFWS